MKKIKKRNALCMLFALLSATNTHNRSVFRPADYSVPSATAQWVGDRKTYLIRDVHLREYPIFAFKPEEFTNNLLPKKPIPFRDDPTKTVSHETLNEIIEELLQEVKQKKRKYKQFTLLQDKNFNYHRQCGLLVLKFTNYPFVLKLFMETPQTFFNRYSKGFDPIFFFYMAGGTNRHVSGLTRIKNRSLVLQKLNAMPEWAGRIDAPRKWFWQPKDNKWIELHGYNMKTPHGVRTKVPGTYAIIADAINTKQETFIPEKEQTETVLRLSNDLEMYIDAHRDNFIFTKEEVNGKPKIIIIDTEHFPTIVGSKKPHEFHSYPEWYCYLSKKCFKACFLRTKGSNRKAQTKEHKLALW